MDSYSITPPPFRAGDLSGSPESDVTVIGSPSSITPHNYPAGLTSRELAHALRGEMLGHFLLQQYIGGGGMGVVFKALDTTLDRIVAVKVVASHRMDNDDLQRRFLVEAQSTARLDHPNIARVHYIGRDRGLPYIVFEYIDGVNIRDLTLQRGPLPVGESLSYVYQIAHALAHAWQRDVVHRDIKPSNILVTAEGHAKLVDMGLARLRQFDDGEEDLTATGITLGTFDYISPEQARDPRMADARSDIYSLGCTLYYMLVGRAPFAQGTALQKLLQHQSERPADLRTVRPEIPESVSRLVRQMLAKDPAQRHQNPLQLIGELAAVLEELEVPLPYPATPIAWNAAAKTTPRWRRQAAWLVPVALLFGLALIADNYARNGTAAAPFPALRQTPIETPNSAAPADASDAAAARGKAPSPLSAAVDSAPAEPTSPEAASPARAAAPLPLSTPYDLSTSLWDFVARGEATMSAGGELPLIDNVLGGRTIAPGEFDVAPLVAPPAVELRIDSTAAAAEQPATAPSLESPQ